MTVYPPFPRNLLATHVFSPQKVCRGNRHRTSRPLQTQNQSYKPVILRTNPYPETLPSVKPIILRTVTPAPVATQTFPSKRVCQMTVYPPFPRNPLATHVFSPQKVCRENKHRTSRPLQTQNPSKVYPKTIIPNLSTDTSAVSKPTSVRGVSPKPSFRIFSLTPRPFPSPQMSKVLAK